MGVPNTAQGRWLRISVEPHSYSGFRLSARWYASVTYLTGTRVDWAYWVSVQFDPEDPMHAVRALTRLLDRHFKLIHLNILLVIGRKRRLVRSIEPIVSPEKRRTWRFQGSFRPRVRG